MSGKPILGEIVLPGPSLIDVTMRGDEDESFIIGGHADKVMVEWTQCLDGHHAEVLSKFYLHEHVELGKIVYQLRQHVREMIDRGLLY